MKRLAILTVALALTACATDNAPKPVTTVTVKIPVPTPCGPVVPKPDFPDSDEALRTAPDLFTRVKLLVAGRLIRIAYERELEAVSTACHP